MLQKIHEVNMIKIDSDYSDYYDSALESLRFNGTLTRRKQGLNSKAEQLKILKSFGLDTPLHGLPKEVSNQLDKKEKLALSDFEVIVWPDKDNEGSPLKTNLLEAVNQYPNSFITEYIIGSDRSNMGQCIRCLYLGKYVICFKVENKIVDGEEQWRAGIANGDSILSVNLGCPEIVEQPNDTFKALNGINTMFPIYFCDLVHSDHRTYAVNFNPSPRLENTPIAHAYSADDVAVLVAESLALSFDSIEGLI